jgi:hypothetical protein
VQKWQKILLYLLEKMNLNIMKLSSTLKIELYLII